MKKCLFSKYLRMSDGQLSALVERADDLEEILRFNQREKLKLARLTIQQSDVIKSHEMQIEAFSIANERLQYERDHFASEWYSVCRDLLGLPETDINADDRADLDISRASWNIRRRLSISRMTAVRLLTKAMTTTLRTHLQHYRSAAFTSSLTLNLLKRYLYSWRGSIANRQGDRLEKVVSNIYKRSTLRRIFRAWHFPKIPSLALALRNLHFFRFKLAILRAWRDLSFSINRDRAISANEERDLVVRSFWSFRAALAGNKQKQRAAGIFGRFFSRKLNVLKRRFMVNFARIRETEFARQKWEKQQSSSQVKLQTQKMFSAWGIILWRAKFAENADRFFIHQNKLRFKLFFAAWRKLAEFSREISEKFRLQRAVFSTWRLRTEKFANFPKRRFSRIFRAWAKMSIFSNLKRSVLEKIDKVSLQYQSSSIPSLLRIFMTWKNFARHKMIISSILVSRQKVIFSQKFLLHWRRAIEAEKLKNSRVASIVGKSRKTRKFQVFKKWEMQVLQHDESDMIRFSRVLVDRHIYLTTARNFFAPWRLLADSAHHRRKIIASLQRARLHCIFQGFRRGSQLIGKQGAAVKLLRLAVYKKLAISLAPYLAPPRVEVVRFLGLKVHPLRKIFGAWKFQAAETRIFQRKEKLVEIRGNFLQAIFQRYWFSAWKNFCREIIFRRSLAFNRIQEFARPKFTAWRAVAAASARTERHADRVDQLLETAIQLKFANFSAKIFSSWRHFAAQKIGCARKFEIFSSHLRVNIFFSSWKKSWRVETEGKVVKRISQIFATHEKRILRKNCFQKWRRRSQLIGRLVKTCVNLEGRFLRFATGQFMWDLHKRAVASLSAPRISTKLLTSRFMTSWRELTSAKRQRNILKKFARLVTPRTFEGIMRLCFTGWRQEISHRRCRMRGTCAVAAGLKRLIFKFRVFEKFRENLGAAKFDEKWRQVINHSRAESVRQSFRFWVITQRSEKFRLRVIGDSATLSVRRKLLSKGFRGFLAILQRLRAALRISEMLRAACGRVWNVVCKNISKVALEKMVAGMLEKSQGKLLGEIARRIFVTWKFEAVNAKWIRHTTAMKEAAGEITSLREEIRKAALRANVLF